MLTLVSSEPTQLRNAEKAFKRACDEIVSLNRQLDDLSKRYDHATKQNRRSFRYSIRLRMAVTEGARNMFYEYATAKADEIADLRCRVIPDEDDDDESSDVDYSDPEIPYVTDDDEDDEIDHMAYYIGPSVPQPEESMFTDNNDDGYEEMEDDSASNSSST